MSFRFELIDSVLHMELAGTMSGDELRQAFAEISEIEGSLARTPNRLVNLSGVVSVDLDYRVMDSLALIRRQKRFPNTFRTALVAPSQIAYGYARMFQSINTNPQITIRIFADERAALAWVVELQDGDRDTTDSNHS